jgi:hypothetical protein
MSSPEETIASGFPKRRAAQPPPVGVEGRDTATGSRGGLGRIPESARQCGKRGARYHAYDCGGNGRSEAGFTNLDQCPRVSVLPPSIHACRPVVGPCSTPSRPRMGEGKHVTHAQGSKGRAHIVARGARDGPARMPRLVQRAMPALAILAALVVGANARDHEPVGIDGGQTRGALFAAQQAASVDASSGGLPSAHRSRRLIEADPRYGSAVRRVLIDVGDAEGGGRDRGAGTPRAGAFDATPHRQRRVNGVGVARLGRRVVDAEDELAAEANGTKPHLTSPRPARVASSTQRASTRAAGDNRPPIANGSRKPDPRWRLLDDDDDDDSVDVAWSKPEDLGADANATSSSQLLVVTNGREGIADDLRASLVANRGSLGEVVPVQSWIAIGGPDAARAAAAVPGVTWVGPLRPEDTVARAWDPILAAIHAGDQPRMKRALENVETFGGSVSVQVFVPPLEADDVDTTRELVDALAGRIRADVVEASGDPMASVTLARGGRFVFVRVQVQSLPRTIEWLSKRRAVHRVSPKHVVYGSSRLPPRDVKPTRRRSLLNYEATEVVQGGELAGVNTKTPFYDAGIDGTGQVVGSGDTGLDDRHCAFSAPGKIAMKRSTTGDYADHSGHGTHVVGSILGSLTDDGSGSKYDGVAKGASVAFTDMGYSPVKATKACFCISSATCTPETAYENDGLRVWDDILWEPFPNGDAAGGWNYAMNGVAYPDANFIACRDGSDNMMCTKYDRTCADEGMTDWLPGGVLWNKCCGGSSLVDCAHDRETNENNFLCKWKGSRLCPGSKCSNYAAYGVTEYYPDGFEKEFLETPDDMGPEMYDYAKAAGAYIHSDSWGGKTPAYDVQVNQVDTYAWNNLNFLPMFAAGNDGDDANYIPANAPPHSSGIQYTYTDGRGTLGNPTNAKNCISVGAALSDNSEAIDNSMLATKLGSYWDSKTDWTWQVDIGGSEGVHWSNALIRGFRADVSITEPAGGDHSLAPSAAVLANGVDLCGAIMNKDQMSGKVVIVRWATCIGSYEHPVDMSNYAMTRTYLQEMVTAGAVGIIMYTWDWYTDERFQIVVNTGSATGWTIPIMVVPGKEGELLKQLVEQRGEGVTLGISGPILPPTNKFDNMASFSSLGPTYDWRIKPDLVAPGDSIYSAATLTDAEVAAGDTCGKVDKNGTSMATPIAAGAFALLRQYFTEGFYPSGEKTSADGFVPSAALLKAVMINGAQALKGFQSDGWPIDPPPSLKQGWGRIELAASVPLPSSVNLDVSHANTPTNLIILDDVEDKITGSSGERGLCVDVDGSIEDLRATLVWTDHPGSMDAEGALVNNLDLQLIKAGDVLWPLSGDDLDGVFHFNGDYYNNVERVIWSEPEVGRYWINVKPTRVQVAQPFALAVTGQVTEVAGKTKATCSEAPPPPPKPAPPPPQPRSPPGAAIIGRAISTGYLSGCLVYLDSNGNGKLDAGEARYTTDKYGEFILPTENTADVLVSTSTSVAGSESCVDAFTGIAPGLLTLAANGVNPGTGRVVNALTTVADRMNRADSEARIKAALDIPDAIDITMTDPIGALVAGEDGGKEILVATTLVTNLVSTLTSLLTKGCGGDAAAAERFVVGAFASKIREVTGQVSGSRRLLATFDLASEETVKTLADNAVFDAEADGTMASADAPSSDAVTAVAKVSSGAASVLKTDIETASTPEAMITSAAAVSAVMQGSEVKDAVENAGGGSATPSASNALTTLNLFADNSTLAAKVTAAKENVVVDVPQAPPPAPPPPVPPVVDLTSCSAECSADDNYYVGSCGFFNQKDDKRWCYRATLSNEEVCCASTSDDCCVLDVFLIVRVAIVSIVAISLACISCCYFCACCCFKQGKENKVYPARRRTDAQYRRRRR